MTNGELFITENPNIEFKLNGSCVCIYFDGVNHYTMPVEWWEQEISLFDKLRAEIESYEADCILADDSKECKECDKIVFGSIYRIIDRYRNEVSE